MAGWRAGPAAGPHDAAAVAVLDRDVCRNGCTRRDRGARKNRAWAACRRVRPGRDGDRPSAGDRLLGHASRGAPSSRAVPYGPEHRRREVPQYLAVRRWARRLCGAGRADRASHRTDARGVDARARCDRRCGRFDRLGQLRQPQAHTDPGRRARGIDRRVPRHADQARVLRRSDRAEHAGLPGVGRSGHLRG